MIEKQNVFFQQIMYEKKRKKMDFDDEKSLTSNPMLENIISALHLSLDEMKNEVTFIF